MERHPSATVSLRHPTNWSCVFFVHFLHRAFVNYIDDARYEGELHAFIRPLRDRLQEALGYEQRRAYVNEAFGDEGPAVWYGAHNLPRLVALKQQWDPEGRFGAGMPIPLSLAG